MLIKLIQLFQKMYQRLKNDSVFRAIIYSKEKLNGPGFFKILLIRVTLLFLVYYITENMLINICLIFFYLYNLIDLRLKSFITNTKLWSILCTTLFTFYIYFSFSNYLLLILMRNRGVIPPFLIYCALLFIAVVLFLSLYKSSEGTDHLKIKEASAPWAKQVYCRGKFINTIIKVMLSAIIFFILIFLLTFLMAYYSYPGQAFQIFILIITLLFLVVFLIKLIAALTYRIINIGLPGYYVIYLLIINTIASFGYPKILYILNRQSPIFGFVIKYPILFNIAGGFTLISLVLNALLYLYPGEKE